MTIDYTIDENDFLIHQLYVASKSDRIKNKRQKSKIIIPLMYTAIGLFFFFQDKYIPAIIFLIIGLLWFFIYPLWEKGHYIKHYKGFVRENYKDRFARTVTLEFSHDFIIAKDNGSESKVLATELEEINEIPTTILIRLKGGQSFILPKDKIKNIDNVTKSLQELATHLKIKYEIEEKWEWK